MLDSIFIIFTMLHFHLRGNNACEHKKKKSMVICHGHDSRTIFQTTNSTRLTLGTITTLNYVIVICYV